MARKRGWGKGWSVATILIADDVAQLRAMCRRILVTHGFEVVEAASGWEAVQQYQADRPDVVLLDIAMPDLDGLGALRQIKELDPSARVAMVTGNRQQAIVMTALQAVVQDFVLKPFEPRRLVAAVEKLPHATPTAA